MKRLLILGGTSDAIALAQQLSAFPHLQVITSLAGRTQSATAPGTSRIGGFGGATGLADYLHQEQIHYLIDATHPFAHQITQNAAIAAQKLGIPHLMLVRPAWEKSDRDQWIEVASNTAAAQLIPTLNLKRIFLTIGRQELSSFAQLTHHWFLMRMIDPPETPIPPGEILLDRGPFTLENERELLQKYNIEAIVSKNSGGNATYAKILAAQELNLPIIMVQRPPLPEAQEVATPQAAIAWFNQQLSG